MKLATLLLVATALMLGPAAAGNAQGSYGPSSPPATSPTPPAPTPSARQAPNRDLKLELQTAITHVGEAEKADSLSVAQQHLGHVVNCIEGATGKKFNASWGNPCEGQGRGILGDLKTARGGAALQSTARRAEAAAMAGVKAKKLADVKKAAKEAMGLLEQISKKM